MNARPEIILFAVWTRCNRTRLSSFGQQTVSSSSCQSPGEQTTTATAEAASRPQQNDPLNPERHAQHMLAQPPASVSFLTPHASGVIGLCSCGEEPASCSAGSKRPFV